MRQAILNAIETATCSTLGCGGLGRLMGRLMETSTVGGRLGWDDERDCYTGPWWARAIGAVEAWASVRVCSTVVGWVSPALSACACNEGNGVCVECTDRATLGAGLSSEDVEWIDQAARNMPDVIVSAYVDPAVCSDCEGEGVVAVDTGNPEDCVEVTCDCQDTLIIAGPTWTTGNRCQNEVLDRGEVVPCGCDVYDETGRCVGCTLTPEQVAQRWSKGADVYAGGCLECNDSGCDECEVMPVGKGWLA